MFKNKLAWSAPILAFVVIFIFSLTLFPSVQPKPKNLPIAIVNEDQGVELPHQQVVNMGENIVEMIQTTSKSTKQEDPAVKWVVVKSTEEMQRGLNNQKYYAAFVIPKDFSVKQASLRTPKPSAPEVQLYINQGMNMAASTMAGQILNGVVETMNNNVRTQLIAELEAQKATLTVAQAANLVTPISKTVTNVNEVGENSANGNAPVSLFQPLWMACMAAAAIVFMSTNKLAGHSRKENFMVKLSQILIGVVVALTVGFGLTWIVGGLVGIHIPVFVDTALFLSITAFCFFLLIVAVLSWFGIKGIAIFALLLFFGGPLLALAPEMIPSFYQNWVYSWMPMRFMVEGLRELFYFGKGLFWSSSVSVLIWMGIISIVLILLSTFKMKRENTGEESQ
ncbi:YhgE/Pip domain-containing protein [Lysinibacillus cavernae]|uniref:YhgE/Pip domain-containing protein n=1 Tax=Lysinibacillus cavernae TaxID=2666135 RepID=UPI0012D95782|nr:ABC transporter permease [Lysinibacillus cavernae]